jgi:hypothetical protein
MGQGESKQDRELDAAEKRAQLRDSPKPIHPPKFSVNDPKALEYLDEHGRFSFQFFL